MRTVKHVGKNNERLYDANSMKSILGINKSKFQREIKKIPQREFVKYKNTYFYNETTLLALMENQLFERLDKMERNENELQPNKSDRSENI